MPKDKKEKGFMSKCALKNVVLLHLSINYETSIYNRYWTHFSETDSQNAI
ncbi:hypothetical protein SAMN05444280_12154 [Tangfeifania diversioriginum]|uniref:Uncharacterized protein n=1 Tax=Tangfeifania diversioriginum TaxID=1168035 RepID=A0A1M6JW83_9BACT|nr:hypothetical protein SAMN05444280_12154 [Tangfeifania diversioriginum]